jgi:hypothetical protein
MDGNSPNLVTLISVTPSTIICTSTHVNEAKINGWGQCYDFKNIFAEEIG